MKHSRFHLVAVAALALVASTAANAHLIDTGLPNGSAVGAYAFDASDFYAGQVTFAGSTQVQDIAAHVLGGQGGETFSIVLYSDSAAHLPGSLLYTTTAIFSADGWNGVNGLAGWNVAAGTYWVGLEIGSSDTLGSSSITGALLDGGAPNPLSRTAFDAGGGYQASMSGLGFGLQIDGTVAAPVPEPETYGLLAAGLSAVAFAARRRRRQA